MSNEIIQLDTISVFNIQIIKNLLQQYTQQNIKWKNNEHQVVISTENFFYKIYQIDIQNDFYARIRYELSKIYQKKFNIIWKIWTFKTTDCIYQIEKRQKLNSIDESKISMQKILNSWGNTLFQLENKLLFPQICKQLQQIYPNLYCLKLIRDCINKYQDYAITTDNNIVLLDDSDWFIAMIDNNKNWIETDFNIIECLTLDGYRQFTAYQYKIDKSLNKLNEKIKKWNILNLDNSKYNIQKLTQKKDQILQNNINSLLCYNFKGD